MSELIALAGSAEIGRVRFQRGQLSFIYSDAWLAASPARFPLSLSMPLSSREHGNRIVTAYLGNLLPDNADILRRWRARFEVRSHSPFALLEHVGEDCAGAVQYVRPERVGALLAASPPPVEWLTERQVGARLRELALDHGAWRREGDVGQFSLSGAQPKTALLRRGNRWGVPSGRVPTTHILKPPHERFPGHAENEHFCLTLARRMGVPAARSEIVEFDGALAIVIERFDRLISGDEVLRLHTEDYCQALATPAERKYENEGGPGAAAIAQSIANASSKRAEDLRAFADALVFNWLIAGTDAHAKNYSVLIGPGGVRFAPLYDLASALPYENIDQRALRLAMRVGRHYRLDTIQKRHWEAAAIALKVDREELMSRIREMTDRFPDSVSETARELRRSGLRHLLIGRLRDALVKRATDCRFAPIEPRAVR